MSNHLISATYKRDLRTPMRKSVMALLADKPSDDGSGVYQWAASTRLVHNIGVSGFCHSGAATHFNRVDWRGECDLFLPWDKARVRGQIVAIAGLAARRKREREQCEVGI